VQHVEEIPTRFGEVEKPDGMQIVMMMKKRCVGEFVDTRS
jgi:hypothetical protein